MFDPKSKTETVKIPVLYIRNDIKTKYFKDETKSC